MRIPVNYDLLWHYLYSISQIFLPCSLLCLKMIGALGKLTNTFHCDLDDVRPDPARPSMPDYVEINTNVNIFPEVIPTTLR